MDFWLLAFVTAALAMPGCQADEQFTSLKASQNPRPTAVDAATSTPPAVDEDEQVVTGVVVDPAGEPVEGADIRQLPYYGEGVVYHSNADGGFSIELDSRMEQEKKLLLVRHCDRNLVSLALIDDFSKPMKIRLSPGGILAGRVVDTAGAPIVGAEVLSLLMIELRWSDADGTVTAMRMPSFLGDSTRTDTEGHYEIPAVPVEEDSIVGISAEGYGSVSRDGIMLLAAGDKCEVPLTVLAVADQIVAGTVVNADGKPVAGVQMYLHGEGQPAGEAVTDADGRFRIDPVCPGPLTLQVQNNQDKFVSFKATAGQTDVRIDLSDETGGLMNDSF